MSDEKKQGIEETLDVIAFGVSLTKAIVKSKEDGISIGDAINFVDPIVKLPAAISGIEKVDDELLDLDDEEREAIKKYVIEEYDQPESQALKFAADAINVVLINWMFAVTYFISNEKDVSPDAVDNLTEKSNKGVNTIGR